MTPSTMDWDTYFLKMAMLVATKSKDDSTQVGCVIVGLDNEIVSTGFNGFPRGVNEDEEARWERPAKYFRAEHAERNAIYNAARMGARTRDCTAYMTAPPCADCARALIQAGIRVVYHPAVHEFANREKWAESHDYALSMLKEADVTVIRMKDAPDAA